VTDPSSPSSASSENPDGVRTYRGRTIEELIPRIRAELGPDAIILREREGLMGGIGGFFAQKCVEIDAQAAPRVNVYADDLDDEDEEELAGELEGKLEDYEEFSAEPPPGYVPVPLPEAPPAPAPDPVTTPSAPETAPAPRAPFLDEASFAARLEEATFTSDEVAEPEPVVEEPSAPAGTAAPPAFIAFDELEEAPAAPEPVAEEPDPEPVAEEPEPEPVAEEPDPEPIAEEPEPEPIAEEPEPEPIAEEPEPPTRATPRALDPAPWLEFAAESPLREEPEPEPEPIAEEPEPEPVAEPEPEPIPEPITPAAADQAPPPPPPPAPTPAPPAPPAAEHGYVPRRRGGLLPAAERMLRVALEAAAAANERREREYQARLARPAPTAPPFPGATTPGPTAPAPAAPAPAASTPAAPITSDSDVARREAELERRLVASGLSQGRSAALVGAAISRRGPFSGEGSLSTDVQALIAASLPAPVALPQERGAVAVVGAGGSGKTRAVAALAAAQSRAGALVSVASLGAPGREDELGALLHAEAVNIIPAMRTRATARAVSSARERGLVIIDTAAAAPRDDATIDVMAETLHSFGLDAIYLTVPATFNSVAAVKVVDSFSTFDLTGMVATHVDETDQLGPVAELAMQTGIPLTYTLSGSALQEAVTFADPERIAAELLR
jgi:flagellar biosynthesis GTPase FlhF